jgi:glutaredoxin
VPFEERDVISNPRYMRALQRHAGRFITPTLVIDGQTFIGFGPNMAAIRALLQEKGLIGETKD